VHAPESPEVKELNGVISYEGKTKEIEEHLINEYDIQLKNQIIADITEIQEA
jgi:hypothetical protein